MLRQNWQLLFQIVYFMKTIYIVRHAKAEDKSASGKDFDRKLTDKGIRTAEKMGNRLAKKHILPDIIITSPAQRALQTAQIIGEMIKYPDKIIQDSTIYNSSALSLMQIIKSSCEDMQSLMLVGHNPSLTDLLNYLCPSDIENLPKAGIAGIKISENKWSNISHQHGELLFFAIPKKKQS